MPLNFEDDHCYYSLKEIAIRWRRSQDEIIALGADGDLEISIYVQDLPLMCGQIIKLESGAIQKIGTVSPHQGVLPLLKGDIERIMKHGSAEIRRFRPWRGDDFRELDSSEPSQIVEEKDLIVGFMKSRDFERAQGIKIHDILLKPSVSNVQTSYNLSVECSYKIVSLGPLQWNLGSLQAAIVRMLHQASLTDQPWLFGPKMLESAGSSSTRLKDVFKSQQEWQQLILSDKRGLYRLNCDPMIWIADQAA
jgi:hypothetical protein